MEVPLRKEGIQYESERILPVYFENHVVGHLRADIMLEFKAIKTLNEQAECQLRNYLRYKPHQDTQVPLCVTSI